LSEVRGPKLHIGIERESLIVAREMTDHRTNDRACVDLLLEQAGTEYTNELLADGGYDSHEVYHSLEEQNIKALIRPPAHAVISLETDPTLRDKTIEYIQKKGYWAWYNKNDFGRREKAENTFYRIKTIFGRKLMSRSWQNQDAETHLICCLLNKMTELGMPQTVTIN